MSFQKEFLQIVESISNQYGNYHDQNGNIVPDYQNSDEALVCLQDLQRFLHRKDSIEKKFMIQLAEWKVLSESILPMLVYWESEPDLCRSISMSVNSIAEQIVAQVRLKEAVVIGDCIKRTVSSLIRPLADSTKLENQQYISLVLTVFKQLLSIPDPPASSSSENAHLSRLQDILVETMHKEDAISVVHLVAGRIAEQNQEFAPILLEIYYLLFRHDTPESLLQAVQEGNRGGNSLLERLSKQKNNKLTRSRHPLFGGVFVRASRDGVQKVTKEHVSKLVKSNRTTIALRDKPVRRKRKILEKLKPSSQRVKIMLKEHADLLFYSYNNLMDVMLEQFRTAAKDRIFPSDVENFFWLIHFVTKWNYISEVNNMKSKKSQNFHVNNVAATLSLNMFQQTIRNAEDFIMMKDHRALELAARALCEMLKSLVAVSNYGDTESKEMAKILRTDLFYDSEHLIDPVFHMFRNYSPSNFSSDYITCLVDTAHQILKCMLLDGGRVITKKKRSANSTLSKGDIEAEKKLQDQEDYRDASENDHEALKNAIIDADQQRYKNEKFYDMLEFVKRFASPTTITMYLSLVKRYKTNDSHTNKAIAFMWSKIAVDLDCYAMFFRLSVLRVLNEILHDNVKSKKYKNLISFSKFITRKLAESMEKRGAEKTAMEILFKMTRFEAVGYNVVEEKDGEYSEGKEDFDIWNEIAKGSTKENKSVNYDVLIGQYTAKLREEQQYNSEEDDIDDIPSEENRLKSRVWTRDEDNQIIEIFSDFKKDEGDDVFEVISGSMLSDEFISKEQVFFRLYQLGLLPEKNLSRMMKHVGITEDDMRRMRVSSGDTGSKNKKNTLKKKQKIIKKKITSSKGKGASPGTVNKKKKNKPSDADTEPLREKKSRTFGKNKLGNGRLRKRISDPPPETLYLDLDLDLDLNETESVDKNREKDTTLNDGDDLGLDLDLDQEITFFDEIDADEEENEVERNTEIVPTENGELGDSKNTEITFLENDNLENISSTNPINENGTSTRSPANKAKIKRKSSRNVSRTSSNKEISIDGGKCEEVVGSYSNDVEIRDSFSEKKNEDAVHVVKLSVSGGGNEDVTVGKKKRKRRTRKLAVVIPEGGEIEDGMDVGGDGSGVIGDSNGNMNISDDSDMNNIAVGGDNENATTASDAWKNPDVMAFRTEDIIGELSDGATVTSATTTDTASTNTTSTPHPPTITATTTTTSTTTYVEPPALRPRSTRERKRKSFGKDFEESFQDSPPVTPENKRQKKTSAGSTIPNSSKISNESRKKQRPRKKKSSISVVDDMVVDDYDENEREASYCEDDGIPIKKSHKRKFSQNELHPKKEKKRKSNTEKRTRSLPSLEKVTTQENESETLPTNDEMKTTAPKANAVLQEAAAALALAGMLGGEVVCLTTPPKRKRLRNINRSSKNGDTDVSSLVDFPPSPDEKLEMKSASRDRGVF